MSGFKEVVVVDAVRSAIGKSGRKGMEKGGQLCQASAQDFMANTLRALLDRVHARCPTFDETEIENVIIGCLSQIGEQGGNIARIASLLAGIPNEAAGCTVNQYCNAGLKAINIAAHEIMVGEGDIVICGGVEIMSHYAMMSDIQVAIDAKYPVRLTAHLEDSGLTVPQNCATAVPTRIPTTAPQQLVRRDSRPRMTAGPMPAASTPQALKTVWNTLARCQAIGSAAAPSASTVSRPIHTARRPRGWPPSRRM